RAGARTRTLCTQHRGEIEDCRGQDRTSPAFGKIPCLGWKFLFVARLVDRQRNEERSPGDGSDVSRDGMARARGSALALGFSSRKDAQKTHQTPGLMLPKTLLHSPNRLIASSLHSH